MTTQQENKSFTFVQFKDQLSMVLQAVNNLDAAEQSQAVLLLQTCIESLQGVQGLGTSMKTVSSEEPVPVLDTCPSSLPLSDVTPSLSQAPCVKNEEQISVEGNCTPSFMELDGSCTTHGQTRLKNTVVEADVGNHEIEVSQDIIQSNDWKLPEEVNEVISRSTVPACATSDGQVENNDETYLNDTVSFEKVNLEQTSDKSKLFIVSEKKEKTEDQEKCASEIPNTLNQKTALKKSKRRAKSQTNKVKKAELTETVNMAVEGIEKSNQIEADAVDVKNETRSLEKQTVDEVKFENISSTQSSSLTKDKTSNFCCVCQKDFPDHASLIEHFTTHGLAPLCCRNCEEELCNDVAFLYHKASCKLSRKQTKVKICKQCNLAFSHPQHYSKHIQGHARNNCKYCNMRFTKRKDLIKHLKESHDIKVLDKQYQCEYCMKKFVKRPSLFSHYWEHAEGRLVCKKCGVFVEGEKEYKAHMKKHEEESPWKCDKCNEPFTRRQQYNAHMQGHERYRCDLCGKDFSSKKKFHQHHQTVHSQSEVGKSYCCETCGKVFGRLSQLDLHIRLHTGEKPLECVKCNKRFRTPKAYGKHIKTASHRKALRVDDGNLAVSGHVRDRSFICDQCGTKFLHKQGLQRHLQQQHSDIKPFKCDYCEYESRCKTNIKRHIDLHVKERRFAVDLTDVILKRISDHKDI